MNANAKFSLFRSILVKYSDYLKFNRKIIKLNRLSLFSDDCFEKPLSGNRLFVREIPNQVGNDSFVIFIVILTHIMRYTKSLLKVK
jgi:hypothetical protein